MQQETKVRITGLWEKQGSTGSYLSGKTTAEVVIPAGSRLAVFGNTDRERDSQPSHSLVAYILQPDTEQQSEQQQSF